MEKFEFYKSIYMAVVRLTAKDDPSKLKLLWPFVILTQNSFTFILIYILDTVSYCWGHLALIVFSIYNKVYSLLSLNIWIYNRILNIMAPNESPCSAHIL